jgi:hypothetical protein
MASCGYEQSWASCGYEQSPVTDMLSNAAADAARETELFRNSVRPSLWCCLGIRSCGFLRLQVGNNLPI